MRITEASIGQKVTLVATLSGCIDGQIVTFKIHEKSPMLTTAGHELIVLQNGAQVTEVKATTKGNYAVVEVELRPKKDQKSSPTDPSPSLELWQEKFKHEANTPEVFDYLWINVTAPSATNSPLDCLIGSELKVRGGCYCNRDFTLDEIKKIVKHLRDSERITTASLWTPQYVSGLSPDDKSYETTTKELNRIMSKYHINTCIRKIHFLAQVYHETDRFRAMTEYTSRYTPRYDPYRGRGLVHLTHEATYKKFGKYMSNDNIHLDPSIVATNITYAFEASGWYWENIDSVTATNENINDVADTDNTLKVSQCINGRVSHPNGLEERIKYVNKLKEVLQYAKNH